MTMIPFVSGGGRGSCAPAANTRIQVPLGGEGGFYTHVVNIKFTTLGDAHTLTLMRSASRSTVNGALAASCNTVVAAANLTDGGGNNAAASDVVAIRLHSGDWHVSTLSSYNAVTFTGVLVTVVPSTDSVDDQAQIVCYGVASDAWHGAHQFTTTVNTAFNFPAVAGEAMSLIKNTARGEPVIFDSPNANTVGTLNYANWSLSSL